MRTAPDATVFYRILQGIFWFVLRLLCRVEVQGGENVPASGGLILAPNHLHILDTAVIFEGKYVDSKAETLPSPQPMSRRDSVPCKLSLGISSLAHSYWFAEFFA